MNAQPPGFFNPPLPGSPASLARAHRLLWLIFLLMVVTVGIGTSCDKAYHATHAFDTVYSPPHLFIYSTVILTILLFEILLFLPGFRSWFGAGFRVPPLRFEVPGTLVITGCGLAILSLAGIVLDNFWHSNFGLDETPWSTPPRDARVGVVYHDARVCRLSPRASSLPAYPLGTPTRSSDT